MDKDKVRYTLFLVLLAGFLAWVGILVAFVPKWFAQPTATDILKAIGVGAISQFFMLLLKDGWQFFFRKRGPTNEQ